MLVSYFLTAVVTGLFWSVRAVPTPASETEISVIHARDRGILGIGSSPPRHRSLNEFKSLSPSRPPNDRHTDRSLDNFLSRENDPLEASIDHPLSKRADPEEIGRSSFISLVRDTYRIQPFPISINKIYTLTIETDKPILRIHGHQAYGNSYYDNGPNLWPRQEKATLTWVANSNGQASFDVAFLASGASGSWVVTSQDGDAPQLVAGSSATGAAPPRIDPGSNPFLTPFNPFADPVSPSPAAPPNPPQEAKKKSWWSCFMGGRTIC